MGDVLAYIEQRGGAVGKVAREVVSEARFMADARGGEVHAVAVGAPGLASAVAPLAEFGVDRFRIGEREDLELYQPDVVASAMSG
ncbi:MAG: electron transfer flavoprotein subunit alpha/FixB family protein, partial [Gemmatimonadota bacterium]|nr:electron transfer flavoprotein subunit alpha/FixB family protein [Gemmatimonadota bacterium]